MELRVLSVNVGTPRLLGAYEGAPVYSAFEKMGVDADSIAVDGLGLAGDTQVDLRVHGGVDKAVYAFSSDNWAWWQGEKRLACQAGSFGENLTVEGADENGLRIGDRFRWGGAILEISQPRVPCFKFQMVSGRNDAGALMVLSGRCGWYFRVLEEGLAPVRGARLVQIAASGGPSVREAFSAAMDARVTPEQRQRTARATGLAQEWRVKVERRGTRSNMDS